MQTGSQLSELRQKLIQLCQVSRDDLGTFLCNQPLTKGTVYTLKRKCSKFSCRCAQGQRHESVVLTASMNGKTRLWTLPKERIEEVRGWTEAYRQFRKARSAFLKQCVQRQADMLRLIDAIEKARTRQP